MNSRKNNFLYILFGKKSAYYKKYCQLNKSAVFFSYHTNQASIFIYVITAEKSYISTDINKKDRLIIIFHILKYTVIIFLCYNILDKRI